jgi:hypothetical protein
MKTLATITLTAALLLGASAASASTTLSACASGTGEQHDTSCESTGSWNPADTITVSGSVKLHNGTHKTAVVTRYVRVYMVGMMTDGTCSPSTIDSGPITCTRWNVESLRLHHKVGAGKSYRDAFSAQWVWARVDDTNPAYAGTVFENYCEARRAVYTSTVCTPGVTGYVGAYPSATQSIVWWTYTEVTR